MPTTTEKQSNTRMIASNSFWYGLELGCSVVVAFATSIPMARVLGPEKLGYFNYVQWLTNLSGLVGMLGLPGATRKYMAEYLGAGKPEVAGAVFRATLKLQIAIATILVAIGQVVVFVGAAPQYRWISFFLVLSLWPSMVASVPSMANVAAERMAFNTAGSLASHVVNVAAVTFSLLRGWDLFGIALGVLAYRSVDCIIKLILVTRWVRKFPVVALPADVKHKMTTFSGYSLALMILNMIVWDRSDIIFLRIFGRDASQIAFFSVAFGLIEKIQTIPSAFGNAAHATILAQYGRDQRELPKVVSNALWYSFAVSVPVLLGLAAISSQLMPFLYGAKYTPAIPVLAVAALLAVPKCLAFPAWGIMEANAKQGFLVIWLIVCAVVNIALDVLLIPRFGAMGAAIANGIAQMLLPLGLIWRAHQLFGLSFRWADAARLLVSAGVMGVAVMTIASRFSSWWAMPVEILVGAAVFTLCARLARALRGDDRKRLLLLETLLPAPLRSSFTRVVLFVAPVSRA